MEQVERVVVNHDVQGFLSSVFVVQKQRELQDACGVCVGRCACSVGVHAWTEEKVYHDVHGMSLGVIL